MGLGNFAQGWSAVDDYDNAQKPGDSGDNSGSNDNRLSEDERLYRFRFEIPKPEGGRGVGNLVNPGKPVTKRILFLGGEPCMCYEHGIYKDGKGRIVENIYSVLGAYTALCLKRNGLSDKECPLCSKRGLDIYPYYIGLFPIVDMGQVEYDRGKVILHHEYWTSKNGEKNYRKFERVVLGAKMGSNDKPGTLKLLQQKMHTLKHKYGFEDLKGTVWDVSRSGKKDPVVGNLWEFVERIEPENFASYLVGYGAVKEDLNLDVPVWYDPQSKKGVLYVDVDTYYRRLEVLAGWGINDNRPKSRVEGASFGNDDIPF